MATLPATGIIDADGHVLEPADLWEHYLEARYRDLGPDFYASRINRDKKIRNHIRGLQALGLTIAITGDEQAA